MSLCTYVFPSVIDNNSSKCCMHAIFQKRYLVVNIVKYNQVTAYPMYSVSFYGISKWYTIPAVLFSLPINEFH